MNLDFKAGSSPLASRQNPVIYAALFVAAAVIAVFFAIWIVARLTKRLHETPEWQEAQKQRQTTRKDVRLLAKKYNLSAEEQELLWYVCREFKIRNIVHSIKNFDTLDDYFRQAYFKMKEAGDMKKINKLFMLKFKLDKIFAASIILSSTTAIPEKTNILMIFPDGTTTSCTLAENTKDYLLVEIPYELYQSPARPEELEKVAFSFTSATRMQYAFVTRLIRYQQNPDGRTFIAASHTSDLITKTRRHFKRIPLHEKCSFVAVKIIRDKKGRMEYSPTEKKYECTLSNISGSGCCITTSLPVKEGQIVGIDFDFIGGSASAIGKIVKTRKTKQEGAFNLHIKFEKISLETQNKLLARVYAYE
ncbi:MAG: PilZ domain-containing protein [Treponemataceae bacterium]|nr:PilZ domain-containing protein [Treponemataceae bacterium]